MTLTRDDLDANGADSDTFSASAYRRRERALPRSGRERPARLRASSALRGLVREVELTPAHLVLPIFVTGGQGQAQEIAAMPGQRRLSVDRLDAAIESAAAAGVGAVLLFGIVDSKDTRGLQAWSATGPVPRAVALIRKRAPGLVVMADVCLCEYTSHGHCGIFDGDSARFDAPATLQALSRAARAYADAGADVVAPSAMADGQVAAIRDTLDDAGHGGVSILAYSAKYASALYGPFRDAAGAAPAFGNRKSYQMQAANRREALREARLDVAEGADMVMVKPAGMYLDVIRDVRDAVDVPVAAYQVSGEYAMIKAAAREGWIDERNVALESLTAIRRAGADVIITYHALAAAAWLSES